MKYKEISDINAPELEAGVATFFRGEDRLRVASINAASGVVVTIVGRLLTLDGEVSPLVYTHTPNTDRTEKFTDLPIGEGWLIDVAAYASSGSPLVGQTFVMLRIIRGTTGATQELATIAAGPVTATQRVAWPGCEIRTTADTPGCPRAILGTDPAAGAEFSETVPTGAIWELIAVYAVLVTGAPAGSRYPSIVIDDGANIINRIGIGTSLGGSTTVTMSWAAGAGALATAGNNVYVSPMPAGFFLPGGSRIRSSTFNLDAADNYGAPVLLVREQLQG